MFAANPALVLNADFQPLSYFPLSLFGWEDTIKAVVRGSHVVVAEYDRVVRSPSVTMRLPSVIALRDYVRPPTRVAFTRFNVFLRSLPLPVLRRAVCPRGADVRPRGAARRWRPDQLD
jgi:5-methylcytosine-specific restriction endonuclease McrA